MNWPRIWRNYVYVKSDDTKEQLHNTKQQKWWSMLIWSQKSIRTSKMGQNLQQSIANQRQTIQTQLRTQYTEYYNVIITLMWYKTSLLRRWWTYMCVLYRVSMAQIKSILAFQRDHFYICTDYFYYNCCSTMKLESINP